MTHGRGLPGARLHHLAPGSQHASDRFSRVRREAGIKPGVNRIDQCGHQSAMESVFVLLSNKHNRTAERGAVMQSPESDAIHDVERVYDAGR